MRRRYFFPFQIVYKGNAIKDLNDLLADLGFDGGVGGGMSLQQGIGGTTLSSSRPLSPDQLAHVRTGLQEIADETCQYQKGVSLKVGVPSEVGK